MQGKGVWVGVGLVVVALLLAGYFLVFKKVGLSQEAEKISVTPILTPTPEIEDGSSPGVEGMEAAREIIVEAKEFSYSPKLISVKKGEKIKLTLKNMGKMSHDFVVEKMNVTTELAGPGKSVTVEFTMNDVGTYSFYCSVGNHRALGMEGTLEVTE